jgi:hypothetical protein
MDIKNYKNIISIFLKQVPVRNGYRYLLGKVLDWTTNLETGSPAAGWFYKPQNIASYNFVNISLESGSYS